MVSHTPETSHRLGWVIPWLCLLSIFGFKSQAQVLPTPDERPRGILQKWTESQGRTSPVI